MNLENPPSNGFIPTKVHLPVGLRNTVIRKELVNPIIETERIKLALVCAPAGYGKSELLLQCARVFEEKGGKSIWLQLDENDNDINIFLAYFELAINEATGGRLSSPKHPTEGNVSGAGTIARLLNRLSIFHPPVAIFLDDYEVIENPQIHTMVRRLISCLQPGMRLIVGTRIVPPLEISDLRLNDYLLELRNDALQFSNEEIEHYFNDLNQSPLSAKDLEILSGKTEGWPALLKMISMRMHQQGVEKTMELIDCAAPKDCIEYITGHVLDTLSPEIQDFLLKSSILDRISAPLCNAVTGISNSEDILQMLDNSSLFVEVLDEGHEWYRYHSIFSHILNQKLELKYPTIIPKLHLAAATWYNDNGMTRAAIHHAIAGQEFEFSVKLLDRYFVPMTHSGRLGYLASVLQKIPRKILVDRPNLIIWGATVHSVVRNFAEAEYYIHILEKQLISSSQYDMALLHATRGFLLMSQDQLEDSEKLLIEGCNGEDIFDPLIRLTYYIASIACLIPRDKFDDALERINNAMEISKKNNLCWGTSATHGSMGRLLQCQGQLTDAASEYRKGLSTSEAADNDRSVAAPINSSHLAEIMYERDDLEDAENLIRDALPYIDRASWLDSVAAAHITLARVCVAKGRLLEADGVLEDACELGRMHDWHRLISLIQWERVRIYTLQGDMDKAHHLYKSIVEKKLKLEPNGWHGHVSDIEARDITRIRFDIYSGHASDTLKQLDLEIQAASSQGRRSRLLKLRIMQALALERDDQHSKALVAMKHALSAGLKENFIRSFADEGEPAVNLIKEILDRLVEDSTLPDTDQLADYLRQIMRSAGVERRNLPTDEIDMQERMIDELTDRERDLLNMIGRGLSNKAIANRVGITANTTKWHLKNLYSKLGAHNRVQAVAIGQHFNLID
ncbi:MAG: LuxR C-terminal-related transcriptional regulator [Candidatus Thiodiazotropha endolucinida]